MSPEFQYESQPTIREIVVRDHEGYRSRTIVFTTVGGILRVAEMLIPDGEGPFPGILYVHWYEPEADTSNRSQFRAEATQLAELGVASIMIETVWSDPDWFIKRTQADDADTSVQVVVELRQAMDIFLDEVPIDLKRLAYVGHDFGAMYGIVMGSIDPRPTHYILMAGTPRFHEWFLYFPPLDGDARDKFIEAMALYDPINRVAKLAPAPVYFQFANEDPHVPLERAQAFYAAAEEPKQVDYYDGGHGLNKSAEADRISWLKTQFNLSV
jgi:dienelactone hydrolase